LDAAAHTTRLKLHTLSTPSEPIDCGVPCATTKTAQNFRLALSVMPLAELSFSLNLINDTFQLGLEFLYTTSLIQISPNYFSLSSPLSSSFSSSLLPSRGESD